MVRADENVREHSSDLSAALGQSPLKSLRKLTVPTFAVALWLAAAATAQPQEAVPDLADKPDFKVLAEASDGSWGAAWGYCSVDNAMKVALSECGASSTDWRLGTCRVTRLGDFDVATPGALSKVAGSYRNRVENEWLTRSRESPYSVELIIYGGEAEGWDEFDATNVSFDPENPCLTEVSSQGPSHDCTGYGRFVGFLHNDGQLPSFGEVVMRCSDGQKLKGERVSLTLELGFACLNSSSGGRVMVLFGPNSHAIARTREAFMEAYESRVVAAGLDRDLCGWDLIS